MKKKLLLFATILLANLCAVAQTKTIVVVYENGNLAALQVPESATTSVEGHWFTLSTPFAKVQVPNNNIRRHFVADSDYRASMPENTPCVTLNTSGLTIDVPTRTTYATVMDSRMVGIKTIPADQPIEFLFSDYPPDTYILPFLSLSKVRLIYK